MRIHKTNAICQWFPNRLTAFKINFTDLNAPTLMCSVHAVKNPFLDCTCCSCSLYTHYYVSMCLLYRARIFTYNDSHFRLSFILYIHGTASRRVQSTVIYDFRLDSRVYNIYFLFYSVFYSNTSHHFSISIRNIKWTMHGRHAAGND